MTRNAGLGSTLSFFLQYHVLEIYIHTTVGILWIGLLWNISLVRRPPLWNNVRLVLKTWHCLCKHELCRLYQHCQIFSIGQNVTFTDWWLPYILNLFRYETAISLKFNNFFHSDFGKKITCSDWSVSGLNRKYNSSCVHRIIPARFTWINAFQTCKKIEKYSILPDNKKWQISKSLSSKKG